MLPIPGRKEIIKSIMLCLKEKESILRCALDEARGKEIPSHQREIAAYQIATIELALSGIENEHKWYSRLHDQISQERKP